MKHAWTILCKESIVDRDTNQISIIDSFEKIVVSGYNKRVKKVPGLPVEFEIVSFWFDNDLKTESKGEVVAELYDPKNKKISTLNYPLVIPREVKKMRTRLRVFGLPVTLQGDYYFKIKFASSKKKGYKVVTTIPFEVVFEPKTRSGDRKE